jgi:Flp pilus assembly pilin Flp
MAEYTLILAFFALVLVLGGPSNPVAQLGHGLKANYDSYAFAVSLSEYPNVTDIEIARDLYEQGGGDPDDFDQALETWSEIPEFGVGDVDGLIEDQLDSEIDEFLEDLLDIDFNIL